MSDPARRSNGVLMNNDGMEKATLDGGTFKSIRRQARSPRLVKHCLAQRDVQGAFHDGHEEEATPDAGKNPEGSDVDFLVDFERPTSDNFIAASTSTSSLRTTCGEGLARGALKSSAKPSRTSRPWVRSRARSASRPRRRMNA
jgi:hypothetical protein